LFVKFYMASHLPFFEPSIVPGLKDGVTGTLPGAYVISVNRYIDDDRISKALTVLDFFTSKETQKEFILKQHVFSAITELYYDPEVCEMFDCHVYLQSIPFTKLSSNYRKLNFEKLWYNYKVLDYAFDYLNEKVSLDKAMENIINILKVYYFSIDKNESVIGFIAFITYITLVSFIAISVVVALLMLKRKKNISFMPNDFWLISVFGTIVMLSSLLSLYGQLTSGKCHMKVSLWSIGFSIILFPVLNQLIINFPVSNKISMRLEQIINRYIFFVVSMFIEVLFNLLLFVSPFTAKNIINDDGKNFQKCSMKSGFGVFALILLCLFKIIIICSVLFLIFIEWNIRETIYEMKVIASLLFIKAFEVILFIVYCSIGFSDYDTYYLLFCGVIIIFSFSSFVCIFIFKVLLIIRKKKENEMTMEDMIKKLREINDLVSENVVESLFIKTNQFENTTSRALTYNTQHQPLKTEVSQTGSFKSNNVNSENFYKNKNHKSCRSSIISKMSNMNILIQYHYKESKD